MKLMRDKNLEFNLSENGENAKVSVEAFRPLSRNKRPLDSAEDFKGHPGIFVILLSRRLSFDSEQNTSEVRH